jgi:dGTPase
MKTIHHETLHAIKNALNQRETVLLSPPASQNAHGIRRKEEQRLPHDYRQCYAIDVDRILNSRSYARYIDKTQVFSLIKNDHITHRVLHVQLVSKIARTIGRFLGLNEDLIEAIALGHDIGHVPFGHDGERILSRLCKNHDIGHFHHNVQSIQFLDRIERKGRGLNLCLQTLDGIVGHNGEIHNMSLKPDRKKSFEILDEELRNARRKREHTLVPMTLEGCVVRMADTISYIGRDIEDAIRIGLIDRTTIPPRCVRILGKTNGEIVYTLVTDIIVNSFRKPVIRFSPEVSNALAELKTFNLQQIYTHPAIKGHLEYIRIGFETLFERYMHDLAVENPASVIFTHFLEDMSDDYRNDHSHAHMVRDFIAGMTDRYFLQQCASLTSIEFFKTYR